jgi:hypothetical protein
VLRRSVPKRPSTISLHEAIEHHSISRHTDEPMERVGLQPSSLAMRAESGVDRRIGALFQKMKSLPVWLTDMLPLPFELRSACLRN